MDRPWEAFDRARRVLRGREDLAGGKSADLPSVEADPLSLTSFLSNTNAQAGAGGPGPLTEVMSHFLLVLCLGLQYDA